jgi:hypothetical protein
MIVPDKTYRIELNEQVTLDLNGMYDTVHYFEPLDATWLRYQKPDDNTLQMVVINESLSKWILENTDIPYVYRESVFPREHEMLVKTLGKWLVNSALDFEPEEWDEEVEE